MPARIRLTAAQEESIIRDYQQWQQTGEGTAADVWAKNNVSKEGGYNVLRRHGILHRRDATRPETGTKEVAQVFREYIETLKRDCDAKDRQIEQLKVENARLQARLEKLVDRQMASLATIKS